MKLIVALFMLATALLGADLTSTSADEPVVVAPRIVPEVSIWRSKPPDTTVPTTTTIPNVQPPEPVQTIRIIAGIDKARYPQWWLVALDAGWPAEQLPVLDEVMYQESRGTPDVIGTGAYGLTQIQWNAHHGWVTEVFGVTDPKELFDPLLNLQVAWHLHQMAHDMYGCGWQPWYMSGNWC